MCDMTTREAESFSPVKIASTTKTWKGLIGPQKILAPNKRVIGQYFLDLGQADFSYSTCFVCGLFYARGHQDDEKVHKTFHRISVQGIQFKGWKNERVASRLDEKGNRVITVLAEDAHHQIKVREVIDVMEVELGLTPGWLLLQRSCKVYLFISSSKKIVGCLMAEPIKSAFQVVFTECQSSAKIGEPSQCAEEEKKQSIQMAEPSQIAQDRSYPKLEGSVSELLQSTGTDEIERKGQQSINVGRPLTKASQTGEGLKNRTNVMMFGNIKFSREVTPRKRAIQKQPEDLGRAILCTKNPVPAVCGVRAIWVSHSERRKGIASHLLDAMRKTFCFGVVLEPSQFAFSEPTPEGRKFARRYSKTDEFLVYTTS